MNVLVVGCEYEIRPDWQAWVDPPAAGNRKPETYAAALPELWAKQEEKLKEEPHWLVSVPTGFRIIRTDGESVKKEAVGTVGFVDRVAQLCPVTLVAIHPLRLLRLACLSLVDDGKHIPTDVAEAVFSLAGRASEQIEFYDPYVNTGASGSGVSYGRFLKRFGESEDAFSNGGIRDPEVLWRIMRRIGY